MNSKKGRSILKLFEKKERVYQIYMKLSKGKLFYFGFSAIGINIMKLIVGTYLINAVLVSGFLVNVENWTLLNRDIVIAAAWGVLILVSRIIDGLGDFPFALMFERLNPKINKRRFGVYVGIVPLVASFVLFLFPFFSTNIGNTIWLGSLLILFYCFYSCVMNSYYASFPEVTSNDGERRLLSNIKSVADVIYFSLGFALIPALVSFMNIRWIALCFLPLAVMIVFGMLFVKNDPSKIIKEERKPRLGASFVYTFKNKEYILWMVAYAVMTFAIQLFLGGQSVYLSGTGQFNGLMIMIMNCAAFGPVPFTMILYNMILKKKGFRFAYIYALNAMTLSLILCIPVNAAWVTNETVRIIFGIASGATASLGIGTLFSVAYLIPSHLSAKEKALTGKSQPAMYFAIQGLFGSIVTGIAVGPILVALKESGGMYLFPIIVTVGFILAVVITVILPKSFTHIGKAEEIIQPKIAPEPTTINPNASN